MRLALIILLSVLVIACQRPSSSGIVVATASSFRPALQELLPMLAEHCQTSIQITSGSTGALVTQILNGAPFDLLISADIDLSKALPYTPDQPFARSPLAHWEPAPDGIQTPIAIANPDTAPFGRAAMQVIGPLQSDLVMGASAAQAFSFVHAGAAKSGYVPLALLISAAIPIEQYRLVPANFYSPILLQTITLDDHPVADCVAQQLSVLPLRRFGYRQP